MKQLLSVRGLRKAYGGRLAVADVSLTVRAGELVGLLGPNGAGKSTTVGMMCGLTVPDAGEVSLAGGASLIADPTAFKRRIGLVPQDLALYEELPARQNVALFGALYGLNGAALEARVAEVLAVVGLAERAQDRPSTFSGGMKRRLNIACALVHDPELIVLDEPTAGVDPQSRNAIFDNLEALKAAGKGLIYTTHYMEEVERLADRLVIIDHGRVVAQGAPAELLAAHAPALRLRVEFALPPSASQLAALPGTRGHQVSGTRVEFELSEANPGALLSELAARGLAVRHLASATATLEDVFLALTGRQLRD